MKRKLLLTLTAALLLTGCSSKISSESVENLLSSTVSEETTRSSDTTSRDGEDIKSDNPDDEKLNYERLFRKNAEKVVGGDAPVGSQEIEYNINKFQNLNKFPFDVSEFSEVDAIMYTLPEDNGNEIPQIMLINLINEEAGENLYFSIAEPMCIRRRYILNEEYAVNRKGIDVFGFEDISDGKKKLTLYFMADGKGYNLITIGMGYEETVKILDEMLESRISFDLFNLDKATKVDKGNYEIDYNNYDVYDALISEWKSALNRFRNGEVTLTWEDMLKFNFYGYGYDNPAEAYYALYDIDGNGIKELILNKRYGSEDINAYIFTIKDGEAINVFGYDDKGLPIEVPWSRYGVNYILDNGLIDCIYGDYGIYKFADDGYSVVKIASSQPYDYPDMGHLADASWRYYVNDTEVEYDYYVQFLNEQGYTINGNNTLAIIDWKNID